MFLTFLQIQRNLYVFLACEKGPKNSVHRDLVKIKNPKLFGGSALDSLGGGLTAPHLPPRPPTAFYELSGCGFESCCNHLNFRYGACFKQVVSRHSRNRVLIHSETRTWHDKNIQLMAKSITRSNIFEWQNKK